MSGYPCFSSDFGGPGSIVDLNKTTTTTSTGGRCGGAALAALESEATPCTRRSTARHPGHPTPVDAAARHARDYQPLGGSLAKKAGGWKDGRSVVSTEPGAAGSPVKSRSGLHAEALIWLCVRH